MVEAFMQGWSITISCWSWYFMMKEFYWIWLRHLLIFNLSWSDRITRVPCCIHTISYLQEIHLGNVRIFILFRVYLQRDIIFCAAWYWIIVFPRRREELLIMWFVECCNCWWDVSRIKGSTFKQLLLPRRII